MASSPTAPQKARIYSREGRPSVEVIGSRPAAVRDLYHFLIGTSWSMVLALVVVAVLIVNALFSVAYLLSDGIAGAHRGSFWDAFFFSIQTMGTIGYGTMSPQNFTANVLVTLESIVGLLGLAMVTGLVFAKFSRPLARVIFSRVAVIAQRDGEPTLMFRVANERASYVVEAQLKVALLRNEVTAESERVRRIHDLHLVRSHSPAFILSWTALHQITPQSPLHGETPQSLAEQDVEIVVIFTGMDETTSQVIHARHSYVAEEIRWNLRFADLISVSPNGRRRVDYSKFHEVVENVPLKPQ